jgi:uncharacterized protein (TIGR03435 family)
VKRYVPYKETILAALSTDLRKALVTAGIAALTAPFIVNIPIASALNAQDSAQHQSSAQTAARPKFDVASVKPAVPSPPAAGGAGGRVGGFGGGGGGRCPESFKLDRSRVDIECATLTTLIGYAFRISPDRVTGPDWMVGLGSPRFDVAAKLPQGASEHQVPEMVQALLADRFQLAIHRGPKEQAIYALVVAKGGLKMKDAAPETVAPLPAAATDPDAPPATIAIFGDVVSRTAPNADGSGNTTTISNSRMGTVRWTEGPNLTWRWEAPSITLEGLAELLERAVPLPSPVIDMTGWKGRYQVVLEVSLNDVMGARPAMPSVGGDPTAIGNARMERDEVVLRAFNDGLRKLGLQLDHRKGPVETLIVDHVEKTPAGN